MLPDGTSSAAPLHKPIKPGTLAGLIEQAGVSIEAASAELSSVGIHAALAGGFGLYPYG